MIKNALTLTLGIAIGLGLAIGGYLHAHRHTEVWTTTSELTGTGGLKIPAGTELIYDGSMAEGFHRAKLYLNLSVPTTEQKIKQSVSEHSFLIPPVWAE